MNNFKKVIFLSLVFIFSLQSIAYANTRKVTLDEYDPRSMTFEERAKWVEENVEPTRIYINNSPQTRADGEWIYTDIESTPVESQTGYQIGIFETQARFIVDENEKVLDWATERCEAIPITMGFHETDITSNRIADNNVRIVYEAWFSEMSGAFFVEHWYNLHGWGAYDVRVVTGSEPEFR